MKQENYLGFFLDRFNFKYQKRWIGFLDMVMTQIKIRGWHVGEQESC